ncbi:MAG: protein phosphatase 2C domain-containing protein, partial [Moorea sp. SIO1F2]|uniref:protein phosphatase 2C domain-containing protein n=1 Tax=Moorena sp. SIO1F2 TaxID=2607819 RepID=UPI0013B7A445
TTVKAGENNFSIVLTCQVGDGMLAAVSQESKLQLLGKPDTGEHGGQTEFITSKKVLDKNNLLQKTYIFPGKLRALMVMSDGVSEDYFPHNPGMLELYGDLVLNQIVNISQPDETEISQQLRNTHLGSRGGVEEAKHIFQDEVERILPDQSNEPKTVFIRSVGQYARELGKDVKEVVASSALLAAGRNQMCSQCHQMNPEEKLQLWLDSYYRRSSFDDRTLVVLYREDV